MKQYRRFLICVDALEQILLDQIQREMSKAPAVCINERS